MRTQLLSSLALVATITFVGCGGGDDDSSTTIDETGSSSDTSATDTGGNATDTGSSTEDAATDTETPSDSGAGDATGDTATPTAPTFTRIYNNIIAVKCGGCHTTSVSGGLDMKDKKTAHAELLKKAEGVACSPTMKTRVVPGNAAKSLIIEKLKPSPSCGGQMPLARTPLTADSIKMIEDWINAGALNN